jgi:hypothetical protein
VRVSNATVTGDALIDQLTPSKSRADDDDEPSVDASINPTELITRLCALAAASQDSLDDARAHRVYTALRRGNLRPYQTELNRLANRFVERLEDAWRA